MKERPILFSAPMVRAILELIKRMTRRTRGLERVNKRAGDWVAPTFDISTGEWVFTAEYGEAEQVRVKCPYGEPGERLWVREEHYAYGRWVRNGFTKLGNPKWRFRRVEEMPILFDPPKDGFRKSRDKKEPGKAQWYQRRARFMPKSAARIRLEVTGVRVERVQEISLSDARSEGVETTDQFAQLWIDINGIDCWDANPWVWVVEFRRVEK